MKTLFKQSSESTQHGSTWRWPRKREACWHRSSENRPNAFLWSYDDELGFSGAALVQWTPRFIGPQ